MKYIVEVLEDRRNEPTVSDVLAESTEAGISRAEDSSRGRKAAAGPSQTM